MHFRFVEHATLPRLAWCAELTRGQDEVVVHHGPWVETRPGAFFEGAWDADFAGDDFDDATTFAGSGGRLAGDAVVFAGPTCTLERLHAIAVGDRLWISNSLCFTLSVAGDAPDPGYVGYFRDLCAFHCQGISRHDKHLSTARGRRLALHDGCNLVVRADLSTERREKRVPPEPGNYAEYVDGLSHAVGRVLSNAGDGRRRHRYQPLATISRGYDSAALAVLVARHGGTRAMTFVTSKDPALDDGGGSIGRRLGLEVTEHEQFGFLRLPAPEAEFHACPRGVDIQLAGVEAELERSVLVIGRLGGIWGLPQIDVQTELRRSMPRQLAGGTLTEFRLRVGFLQLNPLWIGAQHVNAIAAISASSEMRPWSIGGNYDRPIPRRMLEEAGIPRAEFGQRKRASAHYILSRPSQMTPGGWEDFRSFLGDLRTPAGEWRAFLGRRARFVVHDRSARAAQRIARRFGLRSPLARPDGEKDDHVPPRLHFTFHWGFERVRPRYAIEVLG